MHAGIQALAASSRGPPRSPSHGGRVDTRRRASPLDPRRPTVLDDVGRRDQSEPWLWERADSLRPQQLGRMTRAVVSGTPARYEGLGSSAQRELAAMEELLRHGGAVLLVEGGMGIGKTSLLEAACERAAGLGHQVLRARGAELGVYFAFGIVRQLFERRAGARGGDRAGRGAAVRPPRSDRCWSGEPDQVAADDTSFAFLYGMNGSDRQPRADEQPLLMAVDDAHWADVPVAPLVGRPCAAVLGELAVTAHRTR